MRARSKGDGEGQGIAQGLDIPPGRDFRELYARVRDGGIKGRFRAKRARFCHLRLSDAALIGWRGGSTSPMQSVRLTPHH
jgi:hypothetical protein